jgi:hypothetical protein
LAALLEDELADEITEAIYIRSEHNPTLDDLSKKELGPIVRWTATAEITLNGEMSSFFHP